jgi:DNA-binding transcriptional ArsR family regulator
LPRRTAADEVRQLDAVLRALAHPQRRQILFALKARGGTMTAGEIAERFACSWPTTTRHLRVLETAGLVRVEKRGRERIYRLDARHLREIIGAWLLSFESR